MKIFSAIAICLLLTSTLFGQLKPRLDAAPSNVDGTILEYNPDNGDFRAYLLPESTRKMTTLEIVSESGVFDGPGGPCIGFDGLFDLYTPGKLFKLDPAGFSEHFCAGAVQTGLSLEFLAEDLTVDGSFSGGGSLSDAVFLVPEPSAATLFVFGLLLLKRRTRN